MKEIIHEHMEANRSDWWMNGRTAIVLTLLKQLVDKNKKIVDIGAGTGIIAEQILGMGYNVSTIDNSPTSLKILNQKNLQPIEGALPDLKISNKFDVALLLDVLEHVEDHEKSLKTIYEMLNENGYLIITVPAFQFLWTQKDVDFGHFRRYTKSTLEEVISKTNFKIEYSSYYNFFLFLQALFYAVKNKKKLTSYRYSKKRDKIFTPIFKFERHFIKRRIKFLFGVSLICILKKNEKI